MYLWATVPMKCWPLPFDTFFEKGKPILFPRYLLQLFTLSIVDILKLIMRRFPSKRILPWILTVSRKENGGVVITNPNAPTGIALSRDDIEEILKANPNRVVLIDEAYVKFGAESAVPLIETYPNLLVVQTMSKSHSLAGLRVGFAIGSAELIEGLNRVKNSFNSYPVDRLAQAGALAAIEDSAVIEKRCRRIAATRQGVSVALRSMGFDVLPSKTNFIMIHYWNADTEAMFQYLREHGIVVRHFQGCRGSAITSVSPLATVVICAGSSMPWKNISHRGDPMRTAAIVRKTNETSVEIRLNLDGEGTGEINTGIGFLTIC